VNISDTALEEIPIPASSLEGPLVDFVKQADKTGIHEMDDALLMKARGKPPQQGVNSHRGDAGWNKRTEELGPNAQKYHRFLRTSLTVIIPVSGCCTTST